MTDHKALVELLSPTGNPAQNKEWRVTCLMTMISMYLITLVHSKPLVIKVKCQHMSEDYIKQVSDQSLLTAMTMTQIAKSTSEDKCCKWLLKVFLHHGRKKLHNTTRMHLSCYNGVLLFGARIVIPKSLCDSILLIANEGHQGCLCIKNCLRPKVWWPRMNEQAARYG